MIARLCRLTALGVAATALLAVTSPASSRPAEKAPPPGDRRPGQVVQDGSVGVVVPEPGFGVYAEAVTNTGRQEVGAETDANGKVTILGEGAEASVGDGSGGSPTACSDAAYDLKGWRETGALDWRYNAASTPRRLSASSALAAIRAGAAAIEGARDDCSLPDNVSASLVYAGNTRAKTNMNSQGLCSASPDGVSVVGWGDLPSVNVGLTCTYYRLDTPYKEVVEADIRLNKADHRWFTRKPRDCRNKYDVQAIATHEFGHAMGLEHVDEATHGRLTMSQRTPACSIKERTLGLGDIRGLEALY